MTTVRWSLLTLGLWAAAVWGQSLPGQQAFLGQRPDFGLVVVILASLRLRPGAAAAVGFVAGWLQGASAGADLTALTASRTLTAFAASFVVRSDVRLTPVTAGVTVLAGTVLAQLTLMFLASPPDIGGFLAATMGTAITNGIVAGLLDALLRRTLDPQLD